MIAGILSILASLAGQLPGQPGIEPEVIRPRVVIVSMRGCAPCERTKKELASLLDREDCDVYIEDLFTWNRRVQDALKVYTAPTVFAWPDPAKPGHRLNYAAAKLQRIERLLNLTRPSQPSVVPSPDRSRGTVKSPWLSVNGTEPQAAHHVTIRGAVWMVSPNTEDGWRRHLSEDHKISGAWNMTPQQLAAAHSRAHGR